MNQKEIPVSFSATGTARFAILNVPSWSDRVKSYIRSVWQHRWFYLLMTPSLLYFLVFKYAPIWNAQIAFKDFKPLLGVMGSPWIGFQHFETFINSFYFDQLIMNTIIFSTDFCHPALMWGGKIPIKDVKHCIPNK